MKKIFLLSTVFLSSCIGLYDKPLYMKDGKQVYMAVCNGSARDIGDCYELASRRCGPNYEVLEEKSEARGSVKQSYKSSDFNRNSSRQTLYGVDRSLSDIKSDGNIRTSGTDLKLNITNRSVYFVCK